MMNPKCPNCGGQTMFDHSEIDGDVFKCSSCKKKMKKQQDNLTGFEADDLPGF